MEYLYFAALTAVGLSAYAHLKTSNSIGMSPDPDSLAGSLYAWFGGGLSTIVFLSLIISGFFVFSWWFPFASLAASLFLVGIIYWSIPLGPAFVYIAFPVGALLATAFLARLA